MAAKGYYFETDSKKTLTIVGYISQKLESN